MISERERDQFDKDGYFVRPALFSRARGEAACEHLSRVIEGVAREYKAGARTELDFWKLMPRSAGGLEVFWDLSGGSLMESPPEAWERRAMRIGHALHAVDPVFRDLACGPELSAILRALVPAPARVVQSAVIYKQPKSQAVQFGYHQDSSYLTLEPESLALAFVALDDMNAENGCLEVLPGSHRRGLGVRLSLGPKGFVAHGRDEGPLDTTGAVSLPIERGSVIFVHGRTYHASQWNRSDGPRRALIVHVAGGASKLLPTSWVKEPEGGFPRLE